jgi:hypothetical protein
VELVRAAFGGFLAGMSEFDTDGMLTTRANSEELWDPDIELDAPEGLPDISVVYRGIEAVRRGGGNGSPPGRPLSLSTSWLTPGTA